METYIQLIFIMALVKYCLKAALTSRFWIITCYGAVASIIAIVLYPFVIEQPTTVVHSILGNQRVVVNGAVITTIEAVAGIFISIRLLDNYFIPRERRSKTIIVLKVLPGILFCMGIAYFELLFFRWRVGADFAVTAAQYSVIVFVVILVVATLLRQLLKGESMKLELKVILNIGILILGLLVNSSVADYNLSFAETIVEWKALFALIGLAAILVIMGMYWPKPTIK